MMDRSQWTRQGVSELTILPSLAHMFALTRRMGYEMRPIARRASQPPGSPRAPFVSGHRPPFRQGRDCPKVKCFSCGQMGYKQALCPKPDSTLSFKPPGWNMQSDGQQQRNTNSPRETPFRPGPRPNRSECHSSGPQFIIINRLNPTDIIL